MDKCPKCDGKMKKAKATSKQRVAGRTFLVDGTVLRCQACGFELLTGDEVDRQWLAIAGALASEGPVKGAAFKHMRKAAALTAVELAELLNVTTKTISRWETDEVDIDRAAWTTLGGIVLERIEGGSATLARLRALAAGTKPPKESRISATR